MRSQLGNICIDSKKDMVGVAVVAHKCHGHGGNQVTRAPQRAKSIQVSFIAFILPYNKLWMLSKTGEFRKAVHCLDYAGRGTDLGQNETILTQNCHGLRANQLWYVRESGQIQHDSGFCVEVGASNRSVLMNRCNSSNVRQLWKWKKATQNRTIP